MISRKKIGLMGGTFNPVHTAHLVIAAEAADRFGLDSVFFIPSAVPPHKGRVPEAGPEDRYRMVLLAVESNPDFIASSAEIDRGGTSYTVDTVRSFRREYSPGAELYFIGGADSYFEFDTWKDSRRLLEECTFIVAPRKLADRQKLGGCLREGCLLLDVPVMEISSTDIRSRVASGRSIKYIVPERVESYILEHGLYNK